MNTIISEVGELADEVEGVDFGDERLTKRLCRIVETLGARPHDSIPAAAATRAELEATYRFFANEKVTPEIILSKHFECSVQRCSEQPLVLLIQDTTEVDLTRPTEQVAGAGPLDNDCRFGAFVHPLLAMSDGGIPLGFVWAEMWTRTPDEQHLTREEKKRQRRQMPIEDKESPLELLIRAGQERVDADSGDSVPDTVRKSPVLYDYVINLSAGESKSISAR